MLNYILYNTHSDENVTPRAIRLRIHSFIRTSFVKPLGVSGPELEVLQRDSGLIGEDSAFFSLKDQSLKSWGAFLAVLVSGLVGLYYLWINPDTGYGENDG